MEAIVNPAYSTLLGTFARDLKECVSLHPIDGEPLNYAIEMTRRRRLRPADSVQFASALRTGKNAEGEELVLVASDKELLAAAQAAHITTLDPEAADAMEVLKNFGQPRKKQD
jgi:predicted nucleic acid-binding protein